MAFVRFITECLLNILLNSEVKWQSKVSFSKYDIVVPALMFRLLDIVVQTVKRPLV
jgi:hypothetical protein